MLDRNELVFEVARLVGRRGQQALQARRDVDLADLLATEGHLGALPELRFELTAKTVRGNVHPAQQARYEAVLLLE